MAKTGSEAEKKNASKKTHKKKVDEKPAAVAKSGAAGGSKAKNQEVKKAQSTTPPNKKKASEAAQGSDAKESLDEEMLPVEPLGIDIKMDDPEAGMDAPIDSPKHTTEAPTDTSLPEAPAEESGNDATEPTTLVVPSVDDIPIRVASPLAPLVGSVTDEKEEDTNEENAVLPASDPLVTTTKRQESPPSPSKDIITEAPTSMRSGKPTPTWRTTRRSTTPAAAPSLGDTPTAYISRPITPASTPDPSRTSSVFVFVRSKSYEEIVQAFKNNDFDPHEKKTMCKPALLDGFQNVIFSCAARPPSLGSHLELIKMFHQEYNVDLGLQDWNKQTAIYYCARNGLTSCVDYLYENNHIHRSINEGDIQGETPMNYAVKNGRTEIIKFLAQKGADLNRLAKGRTLLVDAVSDLPEPLGTNTIKLLLELKADIDSPSTSALGPLLAAVKIACEGKGPLRNNFDKISLLIKEGANIDWKNNVGETPLYVAVRAKHTELVEELLLHGADKSLKFEEGTKTVLDYAGRGSRIQELLNGVHRNQQDRSSRSVMQKPEVAPSKAAKRPHHEAFPPEAPKESGTEVDGNEPKVKKVPEVNQKGKVKAEKQPVPQPSASSTAASASANGKKKKSPTPGTERRLISERERAATVQTREKKMEHRWPDYNNLKKESNGVKHEHMSPRSMDTIPGERRGDMTAFEVVQYGTVEDVKNIFFTENGTRTEEDPDQTDDDGANLMHYAAKRNQNAYDVCVYLKETLNVHANFPTNTEYHNPLFFAVKESNIDCLEFLVKHNCDVEMRDKEQKTVLFHAVQSGSMRMTNMLVEQMGAKTDVVNALGDTLLHFAANTENDEMVKYLLQKGVPAGKTNNSSRTPLHMALTGETVKTLLSAKALLEITDEQGRSPCFYYAETGRVKPLEYLLNEKKIDTEIRDYDDRTLLMAAVKQIKVEVVKLLLQYNAALDPVDKDGRTALNMNKNSGEIKKLFNDETDKRQAKEQTQNKYDLKLQTCVCGVHPISQMELNITKYDANPKKLWTEGKMESLLFFAAKRTSHDAKDVVQYFIEQHGLEAGFIDLLGETALFNACEEDNVEAAKYLIEKKCDPCVASNDGNTALFRAVKYRSTKCIQLLLENDVDVNYKNHQAENALFFADNPQVAQILLDSGIDATASNYKDQNCLFFVGRDVDRAQALIDAKCAPDAVDKNEETCLFNAVLSMELMKLLLHHGADPKKANKQKETCLHRAMERADCEKEEVKKNCQAVARMLIEEYDVNPMHKDLNGVSAFDLAKRKGAHELVQLIEEREKATQEGKEKRRLLGKELRELIAPYGNNQEDKKLLCRPFEEAKKFIEEHRDGGRVYDEDPMLTYMDDSIRHNHIFSAVSTTARSDKEAFEITSALLELKIDPTISDINQQSPLFYASRFSGPLTVKLLIDAQCDVNQVDMVKTTPLSYAAMSKTDHKMDNLRVLLEQKANPEAINFKGFTTLWDAVREQDVPLIKLLLKWRVPLETVWGPPEKHKAIGVAATGSFPQPGSTVLFLAAQLDDPTITLLLLQAGAKVHAEDTAKNTALFCASAANIPILVENGAKPNHENSLGQNALFTAKNVGILDALVAAHCDIKSRDSQGRTCLFNAMVDDRVDVCRQLIMKYHVDPSIKDSQGLSAIQLANSRRDREKFLSIVGESEKKRLELEQILRSGTLQELIAFENAGEAVDLSYADPESGQHYGFIVADRDPQLEMITIFLRKIETARKNNLTDPDKNGLTPFFVAAQRGNVEAMRYLLEAKCSVNDKDSLSRTPLFFAARGGSVKTLNFLIDNRADPNVRSEQLNETILFDAIRSKNFEMVNIALSFSTNREADLNRENHVKSTPLLEAMTYDENKSGQAPILQFLVQEGANVNGRIGPSKKAPLHYVTKPSMLLSLITLHADANTADIDGRTPLFDCVLKNDTAMIDILIGANAQINVRDNDGRTPVFLCMEDEDFNNMLQVLMDFGADLNVTDNQGQTPISLAKASKKRKNVQQFTASLKKGIVKPAKGQQNTKGAKKATTTGINWSVRLTAMEKLDGRLQHCVATFYDADNPDTIVPYGSVEYKQHWSDLKRENPHLLGMLEYEADTPWTTGPRTPPT